MANRVTYGMGQYRYTNSFDYITQYLDTTTEQDKINYFNHNIGGLLYKDIVVKLPTIKNDSNIVDYVVQYKKSYFLRLTVPQNRVHEVTLDLKLFHHDSNIDPSNITTVEDYQHIRRILVPPMPNGNKDIYSDVILYTLNNSNDTVYAGIVDLEHKYLPPTQEDPSPNNNFTPIENRVYENGRSSGVQYYLYKNGWQPIEYFSQKTTLVQDWKISTNDTESCITIDLVFSPKYKMDGGYNYLLIETDRTSGWQRELQYIMDNKPYHGTYLDKNQIKVQLYTVNELINPINTTRSQIVSYTSDLNHIAVWGHPELMLAVNGEEIKIGQTGFYELKDFNINSLGVVVLDKDLDRFTIDYEYRIVSSSETTETKEGE